MSQVEELPIIELLKVGRIVEVCMSIPLLYFVLLKDYLSARFNTRFNVRDDRGATAVEYGIMVALIAAVIILAVTLLGSQISKVFCAVVNSLGAIKAVGGGKC